MFFNQRAEDVFIDAFLFSPEGPPGGTDDTLECERKPRTKTQTVTLSRVPGETLHPPSLLSMRTAALRVGMN